MKLFQSLLFSVLFVSAIIFTGCNEEQTTSVAPDTNTPGLSKLTLPEGAVISNATFNIIVEDGLDHNITVHQVNVPWVEATETWNIFTAKTAPQFEAASLGNFNATSGLKTVDITALVQGWVDGTIANNGVLLNKHVVGGWINNYRSKEYGDGSSAPYLEVKYSVGGGATQTVRETAFGDTYISTQFPTTPYGSEIYLLNGRPYVDYIKYTLVQFDIEQPEQEMNCETAFAYGGDQEECFLNFGFNRWGWSIGPLNYGTYTYDLYAAAGQCDLSKGTLVGEVVFNFNNGTVSTVTYNMLPGYELSEVHIYVGSDMFPVNNKGKAVVAPGQYPVNVSNPVSGTAYEVGTFSAPVYLIAHAVVCWGVNPE